MAAQAVSVAAVSPNEPPTALTKAPTIGTGAISGVVTDFVSGRPVADAVVRLERADGVEQPRPAVLTDIRGRFVFIGLPAAKSAYVVVATGLGYGESRHGWVDEDGGFGSVSQTRRLTLADGQWRQDIKVTMWRLGSISGRVVDERGEPLVGVAVQAYTNGTITGNDYLLGGPLATTDDEGMYHLPRVEPGRYAVAVLSVQSTVLRTTPDRPATRAVGELESGGIGLGDGGVVRAPTVDVNATHRLALTTFATPPPATGGRPHAYPAVFYPQASRFQDSVPIEVGYGVDRVGIDIQVRPVPTARVSGRVDGGSASGMLLRLLPSGGEYLGFGSEAATTVVAPDGTFTFLNVPDGDFTLLAQSSVMEFTRGGDSEVWMSDSPGFPSAVNGVGSYPGAEGLKFIHRAGQPAPFWARTAVSVRGADVTNLRVALRPTVTIRGRIVLEEGTVKPASQSRFSVSAEPADGNPLLAAAFAFTDPNDPTHAFTLPGLLPGLHLLRGSVFPVKSVTWNGQNLSDAGLDTSAGMDLDGVVITLTSRRAEVNGVVRTTSGAGTRASVLAFPVDPALWANYGWIPRRFRAGAAAEDGIFRLQNVVEGDYYLIAVEIGQEAHRFTRAFLAEAARTAIRLTVNWGDTATRDLTLTTVKFK